MEDDQEYSFKIDAFTPETIPMDRLAEYMADLAKLVGYQKKVHFIRVAKGSASLKYRVDADVSASAEERVRTACTGTGPKDAVVAFHAISRRLIEDGSDGRIEDATGAQIISFPSGKPEVDYELKGFGQRETLDGVVQRVGKSGTDASVQIVTSDGRQYTTKTYKHIAQKLAPYIFTTEIRLHGYAHWRRSRHGIWLLTDFWIQTFDVLDPKPLTEVVAELHDIEGSVWPSLEDPWIELERLRRDDTESSQ